MEQLLKYKHKTELYKSLKAWKMPKFPITGYDLKERGCQSNIKMGLILSQLKTIWANSNFTLSAEELLDKHLSNVLESISTPPQTPNKKMKTTK